LALEMYCYRARKTIGAYVAALDGAAAVIFGGGVGENAPEIRARICRGLACIGLELDFDANAAARGKEARVHSDGSRVEAWVFPVDEEILIARDTLACIASSSSARDR
jgi:acetate kinase